MVCKYRDITGDGDCSYMCRPHSRVLYQAILLYDAFLYLSLNPASIMPADTCKTDHGVRKANEKVTHRRSSKACEV
jgi:hypothetical protein